MWRWLLSERAQQMALVQPEEVVDELVELLLISANATLNALLKLRPVYLFIVVRIEENEQSLCTLNSAIHPHRLKDQAN